MREKTHSLSWFTKFYFTNFLRFPPEEPNQLGNDWGEGNHSHASAEFYFINLLIFPPEEPNQLGNNWGEGNHSHASAEFPRISKMFNFLNSWLMVLLTSLLFLWDFCIASFLITFMAVGVKPPSDSTLSGTKSRFWAWQTAPTRPEF